MSQISILSQGGGGSGISTVTGNSGGAVGPTAGNVNIVGGTGITITGTPGSSTLTVSTNGTTTLAYYPAVATPLVVQTSGEFIAVDTSTIAITIQLPNAPATGAVYTIKDFNGNANVNNISVTTVGGVITIDGVTTYIMNTPYSAINVLFNGGSYLVF